MINKRYKILLDDQLIGATEFEKADAPMGVVFGSVAFENIDSGYDFFKNHCLANNIEIIFDHPEDKVIATANIPNMKILNPNGVEIVGQATTVEGMDNDGFEITILGVPYPFFEEEFPHHVKAYNERFT
ncbi:MAG TPA: hypothetical protein VGF79_10230 [Bacteroidia bacterium]